MLPVQGRQLLAGEKSQPQERRHCRSGQVLAGTLSDVEVSLLKDVGWVEAALKAAIEAQRGPCAAVAHDVA